MKEKAGTIAVTAGVCAALALGAWMMFRSAPAPQGGADPNDAAQVARGKAVYEQHCASCHGARLEGQPNWRTRKPDGRLPAPPHDETGHTWHHPDTHLFRITKDGLKPPLAPAGYESDMPAYAGLLTDEDIWSVLAYIKSTWPERERTFQERLTRNTNMKDATR
ncbi:MAG: cytochrome c [Rhodospirillales bacterium]